MYEDQTQNYDSEIHEEYTTYNFPLPHHLYNMQAISYL